MSETSDKRKNMSMRSSSLNAKLDRVMNTLDDLLASNPSLAIRLGALRERLRNSRLHLAVLGQFKRGKSTFINALLGAPLLPIAVVPLTAIPIFISWRPTVSVLVRFTHDRPTEELSAGRPETVRDFLFRFVAEEANPENRLGVERVDVFYPAPLLRGGTVLIDTPGVGSTLCHNTEAAWHVLSECDAVLFVVSADPPITEAELEYLHRFQSRVAKILFVLNKIDYLRSDEQSRIVEFLQTVLMKNGLWSPDVAIFKVSARDGLEAKAQDDEIAWQRSGMAGVEAHLSGYLATNKAVVLERAIQTKVLEIVSLATAETELRIRVLEIPLEDLTSKTKAFEQALTSIEEQRRVTGDLLVGDQRRLRKDLESRIRLLRNEVSTRLAAVIDDAVAMNSELGSETIPQALAGAMEREFEAARNEFTRTFAEAVDSALSVHQRRIDELVENVSQTAAAIFDVTFQPQDASDSFQLGEEPYWFTESIEMGLMSNRSRLIDRFVTKRLRASRLRLRLTAQTNDLIVRNAENLRWAIVCGIDETFRRASQTFEERLDDAIATTSGVIHEALGRRNDRRVAVDADLNRLSQVMSQLTKLNEDLAEGVDDSKGPSARGSCQLDSTRSEPEPNR